MEHLYQVRNSTDLDSDDYNDIREHLEGYEVRICPDCGSVSWFKHLEEKRWRTDQWNCSNCGSYYEDILEYPCPDCNLRMVYEDGQFVCNSVLCTRDGPVDVNHEALLNRLTSRDYPEMAHKPGVLLGECPICGDKTSVNGGPDGGLECGECGDFYAGQYSDPWYCYAIWINSPGEIRVNEP